MSKNEEKEKVESSGEGESKDLKKEDREEIEKQMKESGVSKEQEKKFLVPLSFYLSTGIHIGMKQRVKDMEEYIYKIRNDKLAVFDVPKIDYKLRMAANLLSYYEPHEILAVSRKRNGHKPVVKFAEVTGANAIYGRFMPGTLTNPNYEKYMEPKIIILTDPFADRQAFEEALKSNITIIAMCDTFNQTKNIDLVIPMNNKGRKSVALAYMLLAREYLKKRGEIKGDAEFKYTLKDFEMPLGSEK